MDEICENCGHSKALHPPCTFCDCRSFKEKEEVGDETRQKKGPASEVNPDDWCIDCGHNIRVHDLDSDKCKYWTDLCKCEGFVARSEVLKAVSKSGGYISRNEALVAITSFLKEK